LAQTQASCKCDFSEQVNYREKFPKSKTWVLLKPMRGLEQQVKVSKMLGMAFVLSISPLLGVGSLIALILGWKASRIIRASRGTISGGLMAGWCILAGALGTLIFLILTIPSILKGFK
jgi:hypothetical protein